MANSHGPRALLDRLTRAVAPGKVVVLYGPRQVGKTTLLRRYVREHDPEALFVSGEDPAVREQLEGQSVARLAAFVGGRRTLIVDEAQHLREVRLILKLLVDHLDGLRVVAACQETPRFTQLGDTHFYALSRGVERLAGRESGCRRAVRRALDRCRGREVSGPRACGAVEVVLPAPVGRSERGGAGGRGRSAESRVADRDRLDRETSPVRDRRGQRLVVEQHRVAHWGDENGCAPGESVEQ